jgi:hypothetical protein
VRNEVVDPATQEEQRTDRIDRRGVNEEWDIPPRLKKKVVQNLEILLDHAVDEGLVRDGALTANTMLKIDQARYERDHPREAGLAKGGTTVSQQQAAVVDLKDLLDRVAAQRRIKHGASAKEAASPEVPQSREAAAGEKSGD